MIVKSIELYNYRLYYGLNHIDFQEKGDRNLFLILGENGFGKTTFLHSLIWCLYGRMAIDVDLDVYRDNTEQGYHKELKKNLNILAKAELDKVNKEHIKNIKNEGAYSSMGDDSVKSMAQYYVIIEFSDVMIPSVPCKSLKIKRSYDSIFNKELVEIFIDGKKNELSNELGSEMFINDFVLSKDIARFFFFDSERIVTLAETDTKSARQRLCSAYNEILGVKKYEDLKNNLINLRLRLRRKSPKGNQKELLAKYLLERERLEKEILVSEKDAQKANSELQVLRERNDALHLQLLREGNETSMSQYKRLQDVITVAKKNDGEYKEKLRTFLEYAPFAIAGNVFKNTKNQIEKDYEILKSKKNVDNQNEIVNRISEELMLMLHGFENINVNSKKEMEDEIHKIMHKYEGESINEIPLIDVSKEMYDEFMGLYNHIVSTYKAEFERLADDYKKNKLLMERTARRISNMQLKENDDVIKKFRKEKNEIEISIVKQDEILKRCNEEHGKLSVQYENLNKKIEEISKVVKVEERDEEKDKLAGQMIEELNSFLQALRIEKKKLLESRIKTTMNALMHKVDFINRVDVVSVNDEMDINLYDEKEQLINKDLLSKGEQQLYATALLKSLVEESGVEFPVFIDSPLQKFDKTHADKIISEFYPTISKQVILFPLLYKEVGGAELAIMKPRINEVYKIHNEVSRSTIKKFDINQVLN